MIVGIGADIINIDRIQAALSRHGERFLQRIYTSDEQKLAARVADKAGILAKRWAAKEACSKALGTGMNKGLPGAISAWRHGQAGCRGCAWPAKLLNGLHSSCHRAGRLCCM